MGYTTHVTGEFAIEPPLTWPEIKASPFTHGGLVTSKYEAPGIDLFLAIEEEETETETGTAFHRTASRLVMPQIDEYRARSLVEQVQRCIDLFAEHTFTGRLDCEGEENTDLWRVVVREGRAVKVEPRIVWPDEE